MPKTMVITGWKQIAKYLNCGVRTAQRWTQLNGLPVHRPVQGHLRGPVIALSEDLDMWIQKGKIDATRSTELISRQQLIIKRLRSNLDEQRRLLEILRKERLRDMYKRHLK